MPRLLELFCGTKSVGRAFERFGWDVVSLDNDPDANPDILCDIMDWDCRVFREPPDFVWASPPCTHYSRNTKGL